MFFNNGLENPKIFLGPDGGEGGGNNHDAHLTQAIQERDSAKEKARLAEEKLATLEKENKDFKGKLQSIEDEAKIKNGEHQKLAEEKQKRLDELTPELERLKGVETKYQGYLDSRKKTLIEQIPEEKRPEWKDSDLDTLEKVVPLFIVGGQKLGMDDGKGGKQIDTTNKKWDQFTLAELDELKKNNPSECDRLSREKYGK